MPCCKKKKSESEGKVLTLEERFAETEKVIAEVDEKAEKLKKKILNTKSKFPAKGTHYFVSPTGNDANDGLTPITAWKTLKRVSEAEELLPGDSVLFERGCMFRGDGTRCRTGVTYSAFGEGAKPIINCSPENGAGASNWKRVAGTKNIWQYKNKLQDIGTLIFDGGANHGVKQVPDYIGGRFCVRGTSGEKVYDFKTELCENFDFFCECDKVLTDKGVPNAGDEKNVGNLYLYCDMGNPGSVFSSIEFARKRHGFRIVGNGVTIDNLCILYAGCHGISSGTTENLTVRNCEIGWIGGAIQFYSENGRVVRFGNGIEIYGGCRNYLVEHNYVYQCYDAGATHQYSAVGTNDVIMENTVYNENLFEFCVYNIEYFLGKAASESAVRYMKHTVISNNILRYAGFGFGEQRPDKGSAAHIKGWDHFNKSSDFVIENNIFDRSRHMTLHTVAFDAKWVPEFRNNTYIQHRDFTGTLGRISGTPSQNIPYADDTAEYLEKNGIEKNAKVYFAKNDWLCDIPSR